MAVERLLDFNHTLPRPVRERVAALALIAGLSQACGGQAPSPTPEITASPTPIVSEIPTQEPTESPTPTPIPAIPPHPRLEPKIQVKGVITRGPNDHRTVYITFDDCFGPPSDTRKVIEIAHGMHARVTFFCVGTAIDDYRQAQNMKLAIAYGDELENHTYNHAQMTTGDIKFMRNQLASQLNVVRNDLGDKNFKEYLVRPPFGRGRNNPSFQKAANAEHLAVVTWTFSTGGTYDAYNTSKARIDMIMKNVNSHLFDKQGNLIGGQIPLLHVRPADIAALPLIIDKVQQKGGTFGLVGQLAGMPVGPLPNPYFRPAPKNNEVAF